MKRSLFAVAALAVALSAQEPAPRAPLGTQLVDARSGLAVGDLPRAFDSRVLCLGPQHYAADGVDLDAGRGQVLSVVGDGCVLRDLAGKEVWTVKGLGLAPRTARGPWAQPRLCGDRVLVPVAGDVLLGLDRANGAVVWRRPDCSSTPFAVDDELVFAVRGSAKGAVLSALAVANGARAFAVDLGVAPTIVQPAAFGVAVGGANGVAVVDRAGPELFKIAGPVAGVVGGEQLLFVATAFGLVAYDRKGERTWAVELGAGTFDRRVLGVTPGGAPFVVAWSPHADSGFSVQAFAARDGALLWERTCEGLGVPHSKYWHDVLVDPTGGVLVLTSHAAGGSFVCVLDPKDGAVERRHEAKR